MRICWVAAAVLLAGVSATMAADTTSVPPGPWDVVRDRLAPEDRAQKAKEALDPATDEPMRFYIVWRLSVSGYSPESAEALATLAADRKYPAGLRQQAAGGLGNFTAAMSPEARKSAQGRLLAVLKDEGAAAPQAIILTLLRLGEADQVRAILGEKLRGHPLELDVLPATSARDEAVARLWELSQAAPPATTYAGWDRRYRLGLALIGCKDKRGFDLLMECLTVKDPWTTDAPSTPAAEAANTRLFRQALLATYSVLARLLDDDFGYETGASWNEQLPGAIARMAAWWKEHRQAWSFEEAESVAVPKIAPGRDLTKRQARVLAAALATEAFAKKNFTIPGGKAVGPVKFTPEGFTHVEQKAGRWVLRTVVSAGPEAFVEFAPDGTDPKVAVNYALR
jgi:hypothetical protein